MTTPVTTTTVALIGNPNTGKSTLFTALSGTHARIGNFPGVTVEKKIGRLRTEELDITLVDLPGTYSLAPRSPDEMVSVEVLLGRQVDVSKPTVVVCIVDATNLERNLYLFTQLREIGLPIVLVLNMMDQAEKRQIQFDTVKLSAAIGVPVVATSATKKVGIREVTQAIVDAVGAQPTPRPELFPPAFYDEFGEFSKWLEAREIDAPPFLVERALLDLRGQAEADLCDAHPEVRDELVASRQRLSENGFRIPAAETRARYAWIRNVVADCYSRPAEHVTTFSDRLDKWLTHRIWGVVFFALVMLLVFQAIYTWAGPLMEQIGWLQELATGAVESVATPGILRSLLTDGLIAGVGSVLIFLPQIVFLFLFIAILEDCGYMARAAFVMDKLMTRLGLSGKSFVPLMSSYACAIPGVMATRVIENRRDRMVTILVAPLMSCSARLPVYVLLTSAFVPSTKLLGGLLGLQGTVLFLMHLVGLAVAIPTAWLLKRFVFPGEVAPFVMELPSMKWPSARVVLHRVYDRARSFVVRAGTLIFATIILVWAAGYFPSDHTNYHQLTTQVEQLEEELDEDREELTELAKSNDSAEEKVSELKDSIRDTESKLSELRDERILLGGELIETSFLGIGGKAVEPVVRPLGWDWKIGVGAIASFPAREVIIATLGTIYSLGGDVDEEDEGLMGAMKSSKWPDGRPVYTTAVALSIMVFFALCAQCGATLAVIRRETNSWRWPIFTFAYMTILAYVCALITFQVFSRL